MSRLTVRPRILAIFTEATLTASETAADFKTRSGSVVSFTTGCGRDRCCAVHAKQINKQGVSRCQAGFVSAFGMVASGLRLFQLPY